MDTTLKILFHFCNWPWNIFSTTPAASEIYNPFVDKEIEASNTCYMFRVVVRTKSRLFCPDIHFNHYIRNLKAYTCRLVLSIQPALCF